MSSADLVPTEPAPWATYEKRRADGVLAFQRCQECEDTFFPPRVLCPHCGSVRLSWQDSSFDGTVYSQTRVHGRDGEYQILLVDLDEGFRVMASAEDGEDLSIGMRVRGRFETLAADSEEEPRMVFSGEGI